MREPHPADPFGMDDTEQFTLDLPAVSEPAPARHVAQHRRTRSWRRIGPAPAVYAAGVATLAGIALTLGYLFGGDPVARSDRWAEPGPQVSSTVREAAPAPSVTPSPRPARPVDRARASSPRPRLVPPMRARPAAPKHRPSRRPSATVSPTRRPTGTPMVAPSPTSPCPPSQSPDGEVIP